MLATFRSYYIPLFTKSVDLFALQTLSWLSNNFEMTYDNPYQYGKSLNHNLTHKSRRISTTEIKENIKFFHNDPQRASMILEEALLIKAENLELNLQAKDITRIIKFCKSHTQNE